LELPEVVLTRDPLSVGLGRRKHGQQQAREESNEGTDHEQLHQRERRNWLSGNGQEPGFADKPHPEHSPS